MVGTLGGPISIFVILIILSTAHGGSNGEREMLDAQDGPEDVAWVVQLSDLHFSVHHPDRALNFQQFVGPALSMINPSLVLLTGDLTDGKSKDLLTMKQDEKEWEEYHKVMEDVVRKSGLRKNKFFDLRGNHDNFGVQDIGGSSDFFSKYSINGKLGRGGLVNSVTVQTSKRKLLFVGFDSTMAVGLRGPTNLFGHPTDLLLTEINSELSQWDSGFPKPITKISFGHFPLSFSSASNSGKTLKDVFLRHSVSAYVCGHLHTRFGKNLKQHHGHQLKYSQNYFQLNAYQLPSGSSENCSSGGRPVEEFWELEMGDWRKSRAMRILAVDRGFVSFVDTDFKMGGKRTIILPTFPLDSRFMLSSLLQKFKCKTIDASFYGNVRALVFSTSPIVSVVARIYDSRPGNLYVVLEAFMKKQEDLSSRGDLYTAPWNFNAFEDPSPDRFWLEIEATDIAGRSTLTELRPFSLSGVRAKLSWTWKEFFVMGCQWAALYYPILWSFYLCIFTLLLIPKLFLVLSKEQYTYRSFIANKGFVNGVAWVFTEFYKIRLVWQLFLGYLFYLLLCPWLLGQVFSEGGDRGYMTYKGWVVKFNKMGKLDFLGFPDVMVVVLPHLFSVVLPTLLVIGAVAAEAGMHQDHLLSLSRKKRDDYYLETKGSSLTDHGRNSTPKFFLTERWARGILLLVSLAICWKHFMPVELWTGKQVFGVLLRPHADMRVYLNLTVAEKTYSKSRETMCPNDGYVYFRNSELISGQLGKATLGNGNKDGLYSILLRDYNTHAAASCMNRLAKLSARWIGNHGFSIGIDDVQPGDRLNDNKGKKISEGTKSCDKLIQDYNEGNLKLQPGCDAAQTLEAEITNVLNTIRETTAKVCMEELHWRNSPLIMSQCGSKGSPINISQMIACVGQQSVGGRRAPNGFFDRSLPHFRRMSKTPAAKGFVANSFYSGLTATEFFFHTMGGREGLVDTAVKTADTGYMSRRLIKALEDLSVQYDNTVRSASSSIVQFVYGDDGMDPSQMEGSDGFPLNFNRLLMKIKATCPPGDHVSLTPSQIRKVVHERLEKHDMTPDGGCSEAFSKKISEFLEGCGGRYESTRKILKLDAGQFVDQDLKSLEKIAQSISGLTLRQLEVFLDTCISRYHLKKIEAGTAIGAIGAQSIGEPGTQMTLKTFHFAGVASMNVTLGVPRIKEIINAAKKISTPIITAALDSPDNLKLARLVKGRIEKTVLGEVAKSIKIVMASRLASIVITLDMGVIQTSQLGIDALSVKESILRTPKIKLKEQHIKVLDGRKLEVFPPSDKSKLHFELHWLKNRLPTVVVKGINTVERAVINKDKAGKYNLLVEGTGLLAVLGMEGINGIETKSNHIMEVQQTLGIEAARKCIVDEIQYTMKSHGMSIDIRHMMLLGDLMTFKGEVLGITRHGIQKMKDSVLMLASFEKTADHLFNAAVNGRDDKIEGVSECIIMGIPMQIGTGNLKVMQRVPHVQLSNGLEPILS